MFFIPDYFGGFKLFFEFSKQPLIFKYFTKILK